MAVVFAVWPAAGQPQVIARGLPAGTPQTTVPPKLWAVEIDAHAATMLRQAFRARMRHSGVNALVVDPTRLNAKQLARVARAARVAKLSLVEVLPPANARRTKSVRSVRATCRAAHRPARTMCATRAPSAAKALQLAGRRGPGQLVFVRLAGPRKLAQLSAASESGAQIVAMPTLSGRPDFAEQAWADAIDFAAANRPVDLGVSPEGAAGRRALGSFLALLATDGTTGPPNPPTNLTKTGASATSISFDWVAPAPANHVAGYTLYVDSIAVGTTTDASYTASGLACGTSYMVAVDAYDVDGNHSAKTSLAASTAGCADTSPPTVPGSLSVTGTTTNSVSLSWSASNDNVGVAGYTVYANLTQVGTTAGTSFTAAGLACGTSYTLAVDAYDAAGNHSGRTTVTTSTGPCPGDTTPPTTPGTPTATGTTTSSVSVSWSPSSDNFGVAGYTVYVNSTQVGTTTGTSYTVGGLACGTSYAIAVDAYDAAGNHSGRASRNVSTAACPDGSPPTTPGSLAVTGTTTSSVSLSWSASSDNVGVAGYTVYVNSNPVGTTTGTSYTAAGLACGTSYTLAVDAFDAAGNHSTQASTPASTANCGGGGPATANVWLSPTGSDSGSSCTRFSTPVAQPTPSAVCGSLAKAYSLASCGDTIDIVSGSFATDQFLKDNSALDSCSSPVVIQAASGNRADVIFWRILSESNYGTYAGAASWFTLQHVTVRMRFEATQPGHNFTLNDVDGGTFDLNGVQHVLIQNSDWGPCWSDVNYTDAHPCDDPAKIQSGGGGALTNDVVIRNNNIHDWTFTQQHLTCLAPWGGNNITIEGNRIWNCDVFGIEVSSVGSGNCATDPSWDHLVIQNNWFGRINQETPINNNAIVFTHGGVWTNTLIRYNSFAGISGITTTSSPPCEVAGVTAIGNVGPAIGCVPGMTYQYNVWAGTGTCGTGDVNAASLPYVNTSDQASGDYHLSGAAGSTLADNRVPCVSGPGALAYDREGHTRPGVAGQNCDAGAQER